MSQTLHLSFFQDYLNPQIEYHRTVEQMVVAIQQVLVEKGEERAGFHSAPMTFL